MSNLQRVRSQYEDNNGTAGKSSEDESSDNEGGRKSASGSVNKTSEEYKKRRQRNNEGDFSILPSANPVNSYWTYWTRKPTNLAVLL